MAINVDTVYQKVLALANKEQRGYITPQEFNLLADKAQLDLFDQYFHDLKTANHKPVKNQTGVSGDDIEMTKAKLHSFKTSSTITQTASDATLNLPTDLYFIDVLLLNNNEVTELTKKEIAYTENNPLTRATTTRPIYVREDASNSGNPVVTLYPTPTTQTSYNMHYYKRPVKPKWAYVVINDKALYNVNLSVNFELHPSEEEKVIMRILELSGIVIRNLELAQTATTDKINTLQQQND